MSDAQLARPARNPARRQICSFCNSDRAEIALLFVSEIGGEPPCICDRCVEERMAFVTLDRKAPGLVQAIIETQREKLHQRWLAAHPSAAEAL